MIAKGWVKTPEQIRKIQERLDHARLSAGQDDEPSAS